MFDIFGKIDIEDKNQKPEDVVMYLTCLK